LYPSLYPRSPGFLQSLLFCCSPVHSMFKHETSNVLVAQIGIAKQPLEPEGAETVD
jgi:hypothetical protein